MPSMPAPTEETPLLVEATPEVTDEEAHEFRGKSSVRWWILFGLYWSWAADYHLVFAPSALEDSLVQELGMTTTQFSVLLSVIYALAIVGPAPVPYLVKRFGAYPLIFVGNVVNIGIQVAFAVGIANNWYALLVFLRCLSGIMFGFHESVVMTVVSFWFVHRDITAALSILFTSITLGILSARYLLPAVVTKLGLPATALVSAACPLLALAGIATAVVLQRRWFADERVPLAVRAKSTMHVQKHDVRELRVIRWPTWVALVSTALSLSVTASWEGELLSPLTELYGYSEVQGNRLLSIFTFMVLFLSIPAGILVAKVGRFTYFQLLQATTTVGSPLILALHGPPALSLVVFGVALIALPSSFSIVQSGVEPRLKALMAASWTSMGNAFACFALLAFGIVKDVTGTFYYSVVFVLVLALLGLVLALIVFFHDFSTDGPLHKSIDEQVEKH